MPYIVRKAGIHLRYVYLRHSTWGSPVSLWVAGIKRATPFCLTEARKLARAEKAEFLPLDLSQSKRP